MFNHLPIWIYDEENLKKCAEESADRIFNDMMVECFWWRVRIKEEQFFKRVVRNV